MKIPKRVYTERYANKLREVFARSYGLGRIESLLLGQAVNEVYKKHGCFGKRDEKGNWINEAKKYVRFNRSFAYPATDRSKDCTVSEVCEVLKSQMENPVNSAERKKDIQRIVNHPALHAIASNKRAEPVRSLCKKT